MTKKKVDVIEVVKHGTALVLPDGMSEEEAIIALHNHKKAMEEPVDVTEVVNVSPYDGANALRLAMEEMGVEP